MIIRRMLLAGLLASLPSLALAANLVPYEAEYSITAGAGDRAPQIGTARQRLKDGCLRQDFERDVNVSLALTQSLRYDVKSTVRASEGRSGRSFDYKLDRTMNGEPSQRSGQVTLTAAGGKAALHTPNGPKTIDLPSGTLLPQRMVEAILDHLQKGETHFSVQAFDAEVVSNLVEVGVQRVAADEMPMRPQDASLVGRIGAPGYPLVLSFTRPSGKPLFTAHVMLHANGVISRLIAGFGPFTVAANLSSFSLLPQLRCAPPIRAQD
jgi:hypothetical protein